MQRGQRLGAIPPIDGSGGNIWRSMFDRPMPACAELCSEFEKSLVEAAKGASAAEAATGPALRGPACTDAAAACMPEQDDEEAERGLLSVPSSDPSTTRRELEQAALRYPCCGPIVVQPALREVIFIPRTRYMVLAVPSQLGSVESQVDLHVQQLEQFRQEQQLLLEQQQQLLQLQTQHIKQQQQLLQQQQGLHAREEQLSREQQEIGATEEEDLFSEGVADAAVWSPFPRPTGTVVCPSLAEAHELAGSATSRYEMSERGSASDTSDSQCWESWL